MRQSDEDDFVAFVRASSPALLHAAWLLTGDQGLAEELVQESLERAYTKWPRIKSDRPLPYVRRTLVNLNTDRWRRRHKESLTFTGSVPEAAGRRDDGDVENRDQVVRLLQSLPKREREVVVLRYYCDLPEREVADLLDVSLGTVKSSASRGLSTIRTTLMRAQEVQR